MAKEGASEAEWLQLRVDLHDVTETHYRSPTQDFSPEP